MTKSLTQLRSQRWFAADDMRGFAHRQRTQQMGMRREEFMNKPVIGIINTWSDLSPCHSHLRQRADAVKRGVWAAGGYPVELPAMSLGEVMVKPTTMLYRNFLAMEVEELLRSHPIDGAVLLGGCDKTTPGLITGALSMDLPFIFCPAGPMSNGQWRGITTGAGTHTKKYWDERRADRISAEDWIDLESRMTRSAGTCSTMGTASTMTSIVDTMGLTLPGASSIPAVDSGHTRMASACGSRIVDMVFEDLRPAEFLDEQHFYNGLVAWMAMGGSTNAAIHMIALAGRAGVHLTLDDMAKVSSQVPVLANIFPSGNRLMEDFYFAGGLHALLKQLTPFLHLDAKDITGRTLGDHVESAECYDDNVIRNINDPVIPLSQGASLGVLKGNLCPNGAVIKSSAADPKLKKHEGPAVVFDSQKDLKARIDDPELEITPDSVLVLRNAGPIGAPGMPEWGNLPIPVRLLKQGIKDMVRISDARMSGTHYGTCILHVSPESAAGGPLSLVRTGDVISLDVVAGRLDMLVSDEELERRRAEWSPPELHASRSFTQLYQKHVSQADKGCDFDFLAGSRGVMEPDIY